MKPQIKLRMILFVIVVLIPIGVYMLAASTPKLIGTPRVIIHYIRPLTIWKLGYQQQNTLNPTFVEYKPGGIGTGGGFRLEFNLQPGIDEIFQMKPAPSP